MQAARRVRSVFLRGEGASLKALDSRCFRPVRRRANSTNWRERKRKTYADTEMTMLRLNLARRHQLLAAGCFVLFQLYFFAHYRQGPAAGLAEVFIDDGEDELSVPYQRLIRSNGNGFGAGTSYGERCSAYFDLLYTEDATWRSGDFHELPYERWIFDAETGYVRDRVNRWMENLDKDRPEGQKLSEEQKSQMAKEQQMDLYYKLEYQQKARETRNTEDKLVESATHLRVYGACFLDQYGHFNDGGKKKEERCHDIETRLFQWLSGKHPRYTRWDGKTISSMPIMSEYVDGQIMKGEQQHKRPTLSPCYMKTLRDSLNGRGIVISAADKHVEQLVSLFAVLRSSGNTLPIQIVHSGDLSQKSQQLLIKLARTTKDLNFHHLDNLETALEVRNLTVPHDGMVLSTEVEKLFPPQELWFVDVTDAVSKHYRSKFGSYANKLLAYFFSSFQHTMLIDTDTIPVSNLDTHIFHSPFYEQHGAYFFKDREIHYQNRGSDVRFFKKLLPSKIDNALFGINPVTDRTMGNRFFKYRFQHFQESGVVAIDKKRHFTGVLSTLQLQIWSPAAAIVWGDKELFWLGMSMAGDEDYYMNHWAAGSAGFVTPKLQRIPDDPEKSKNIIGNEVCSTHPAHMSSADNTTLLWYNSGVTYCKKENSWNADIKRDMFRKVFASADELKNFYQSYHHIEAVIVPKHGEFYRKSTTGENERGWQQKGECAHFLFCAYDKVGGVDDPVSNGLLVRFDERTKKLFDFYGSSAQFAFELFGVNIGED